jgi:hypothetical protein
MNEILKKIHTQVFPFETSSSSNKDASLKCNPTENFTTTNASPWVE